MFTRETPGITRANLSVDPLATEEESTPGSGNPFDDENVGEQAMRQLDLTGYSPVERDGPDPELPIRDEGDREPYIPRF